MFRLVALLAVLALLACSQPQPSDPDVPPDPGVETAEWKVELPQSETLAEANVETSKKGPWTVRRTVSKSSGERVSGAVGLATRGGGGGAVAKGDAGAPMPGDGADLEHEVESLKEAEHGTAAPAESHDEYDGPAGEAEPTADPSSAPPPPAAAKPSGYAGPARNSAAAAPLKAGKTDDNEKFDAFVEFLVSWSDRADTAGQYDMLDVRGRTWIRVVNAAGKPIPAARVSVISEAADQVLLRGTTYGDGRVPFYPRVASAAGVSLTAADGDAPGLLVEVTFGTARERVRWDGAKELTVPLDVERPISEPVLLDVLFLIDTTGSMGDEIERVKQSLLAVTRKLRSLSREFDLRYAAVLYRDVGDEYVTKSHPFTGDIEAFDAALQTIRAAGGGDGPESLNQGIASAVGRTDWRDGAAKVMFLIADAPPHMDYQGDVLYGESLKAAVGKGIRIHSVAASGLPAVGSLVFRQIAQFTRGKFIFVEYGGSVAASGAKHGVAGAKKSNNLDDILFDQIRDEVARWGR